MHLLFYCLFLHDLQSKASDIEAPTSVLGKILDLDIYGSGSDSDTKDSISTKVSLNYLHYEILSLFLFNPYSCLNLILFFQCADNGAGHTQEDDTDSSDASQITDRNDSSSDDDDDLNIEDMKALIKVGGFIFSIQISIFINI